MRNLFKSDLFLFFLLIVNSTLFAQSQSTPEEDYYVVVGTFRNEKNALAYRQSLDARGQQASIHSDSATGLNYVHVGKTLKKKDAVGRVLSLRKTSEFRDAWMKAIGDLTKNSILSAPTESSVQSTETESLDVALETMPEAPTTYEVSDTELFLQLYNAANDKLIDGTVEIIDTERSRLIEKVKGNTYYILPDPKSKSKRITLIGNVFGYRKIQTEISYPIAASDSLNPNMEMVGTIVMLRFDMVRYSKGDINVLYNVYFFNDAAIMQPESKYELNNLLEMMQENPRMRIKLHGHSNGNASGKILSPGEEKNLFSLTNAIEGLGSAKELSFKRAEVIKDYLVASGITSDRVELKSWGGKRPLYDKNSANARRNVRVEVEILAD
jgi:outer membrane protein OmpA-like peptidoglycan-associated protein